MHAEIAATVAREHTPGLSPAACARLEAALGRSPTVLELEVYVALLRQAGEGAAEGGPLQLALTNGGTLALGAARGREGTGEAALEIVASGAHPLTVMLGHRQAADGRPEPAAAPAVVQSLGFPVTSADFGPAATGLALVLGWNAETPIPRRQPAAGDVLVYLGAVTEREGPSGPGATYAPPGPGATEALLDLLQKLQQRPGLILAVRLLGKGGLARAAVGGTFGVQLMLDAVPRHPVALPPRDILLAESTPRALVVVAAAQVDGVLAAARAQGATAAAIGLLTTDRRLLVTVKPSGSAASRILCELPLAALAEEPPPAKATRAFSHPATPSSWTQTLSQCLRDQASEHPRAAVVLRHGLSSLAVAARPLAAPADASAPGELGWVRRALSEAFSHVAASGAVPCAAANLFRPTDGTPSGEQTPAKDFVAACDSLGITAGMTDWATAPGDGLVIVVGQGPADTGVAMGRFPGPGCLLAILGFDDAAVGQEQAAAQLCGELVRTGLCVAVQPIGAGGLLLALGLSCAQGGVGCSAVLAAPQPNADRLARSAESALLADTPGRYLLAIPAHRQADARLLASERGVPLWPLGRTGGGELIIRRSDDSGASTFSELVRVPVAQLAAELARR